MVQIEFKIEMVPFERVVLFSNAAKKERSIIEDSHHTTWYLASARMREHEIQPDLSTEQVSDSGWAPAGCSALMILRGNEGRIKGTYVTPGYRGLGLSKQLNDKCLMAAMLAHCSSVTAFVTVERNLKWYLQNGFRVLSKRGSIAFVKRIL